MNRKRFSVSVFTGLAIAVVALGIALSGAPPAASAGPPKGPSYAIVKLSDTNSDALAFAMNNAGQIVGQINEPGPVYRAAYWELNNSGGTIQSSLSFLSGGITAHGINVSGEIVGGGYDGNGNEIGMYWSGPDADPLVLPPLPEHDASFAQAINNDGVICGLSKIDGGLADTYRAVAWRVNIVDGVRVVRGPIALPDAETGSNATSINDNDANGIADIAGRFSESGAAVVWTVQSLPDGSLTIASGLVVLDLDAEARGINDSGAICGTESPPVEAIVWTASSRRVLNRARYVEYAWANDINNNGVIVGGGEYWRNFNQGLRATMWPNATSTMILLDKFLTTNSPFTHLSQAVAVNDQGLIVGYGWMGSVGRYGAFVAVPK